MKTSSCKMLFLVLVTRRMSSPMVHAFGSQSTKTAANSSTRLGASFFQDVQKNFFSTESKSQSQYYTVGITGASGLVGTALRDELSKQETLNGKPIRIVKLQRSDDIATDTDLETSTETELSLPWNPNASDPSAVLDPAALAQIDSIVHLGGENVATGSGPLGFLGLQAWSPEKKREILDSRTKPTKALASALSSVGGKDKSLLVASGIGIYGNDFMAAGENTLDAADESFDTTSTSGFLANVSREWEAAAATTGARVANLRFGVVLSKNGGALAKLFPIFFLGGGGNVGSGQQYFSFVSARDVARAVTHTLVTPSLKGPINVCAPYPCTNAEFTTAMGKNMGRPTILPFPGFAVSLLFGEMGEEMLLGGVRAVPGKLESSGFEFQHPTIDDAVRSALSESV